MSYNIFNKYKNVYYNINEKMYKLLKNDIKKSNSLLFGMYNYNKCT